MPCDNNELCNLNEYEDVLSKISQLCIQYNVENVCILGDMNTQSHSWHTKLLQRFIEHEDLYIALNHYRSANVKYS